MGIVSTNVAYIGNGSGSGSGSDNIVDLPTHIKSLAANGGNKFVTLSIEYENTDYISGTQVNFKLGDYPTSPSDGDFVTVEGAAETIKVEGLTNKLEYYFRVFLFREIDGIKHFQTDVVNARTTCTPRAVEIIGATPIIEGDDYLVFDAGCTFTITAPAGTRFILGDGGQGGGNGDYIDSSVTKYAANGNYGTASTLKIDGQTYNATGTYDVVSTKAGPIGGGGQGGTGGRGGGGDYDVSGGPGGQGGQGGKGGAALGPGGQGGQGGDGGYATSSSGRGGTGGKGGSNGAGATGSNGATGESSSVRYGGQGGTGGNGAAGNPPGIYSYGGNGGRGSDNFYGNVDDEYDGQGTGGDGGNGGRGGWIRTFVLPETVNATVVLTIGKGGAGSTISGANGGKYLSEGQAGGNGILIIEW